MYDNVSHEQMKSVYAQAILDASPVRKMIVNFAAERDLSIDALLGPSRKRAIAHPRQDLMAKIKRDRDIPLTEIARIFNRDHTTVIHAIKKSNERARARAWWDTEW